VIRELTETFKAIPDRTAQEMREKLLWHLTSINVLAKQLKERGYPVKTAAMSTNNNIAFLLFEGGRALEDQVRIPRA